MTAVLLLIISLVSFAEIPSHWSATIDVHDRHEFYQNNDVLRKPENSWQTLFGLVYPDTQLITHKDCVFYKVPGDTLGELKIKRIRPQQKCEDFLFKEGDRVWSNIKALQFVLTSQKVSFLVTRDGFEIAKWEVEFANGFDRPEPKMLLSSAELRLPKLMMLAPAVPTSQVQPSSPLKENFECHAVRDDCTQASPSVCHQCPQGWYEIPNGCPQGPKFCGILECGKKNRPACRRGMKHQRLDKLFDCREDHSFAYCSKGLQVQCEGGRAYCR